MSRDFVLGKSALAHLVLAQLASVNVAVAKDILANLAFEHLALAISASASFHFSTFSCSKCSFLQQKL